MPKMKGAITERDWHDVRIDPATHFPVALGQDEYHLHQGDLFVWKDMLEVNRGATRSFFVKYPTIPTDGEYYVRWTTAGDRLYTLSFFAWALPETLGTLSTVPVVNRRLNCSKTLDAQVYIDPVIGAGTQGVNSSNALGGQWLTTSGVGSATPILVPAGFTTLITITNRSVSLPLTLDVALELAPHAIRNEIPEP